MAHPFSIAGAHLKVFVNGKLLGYATAVPTLKVMTSHGDLRAIDSPVVRSRVPRMYGVNGTMQVLRGRSTGGLEGAGMVPSAQAMLRQKYLTIELQDRITQDIVFSVRQCDVDDQSWQIQAKGLVVGTFNFTGITFDNEATN